VGALGSSVTELFHAIARLVHLTRSTANLYLYHSRILAERHGPVYWVFKKKED